MLWIEDIVGNTLTLPFLTNFRVDMVSFVDLQRWLLERENFQPFHVHKMKMN
jgi:hypothetical protein